jgi:hypothetical protein
MIERGRFLRRLSIRNLTHALNVFALGFLGEPDFSPVYRSRFLAQ